MPFSSGKGICAPGVLAEHHYIGKILLRPSSMISSRMARSSLRSNSIWMIKASGRHFSAMDQGV